MRMMLEDVSRVDNAKAADGEEFASEFAEEVSEIYWRMRVAATKTLLFWGKK